MNIGGKIIMCRNQEIRVKLKKEEKETILHRAKEMGMNPAAYLRLVGLKAQFTPKVP